MDKDLLKLLENSGFTQKEALVYLALLELGQGTVAQIAKVADIKRPIIYVILEGLLKRGYVSELPNRKINAYQAADPAIILNQLKDSARNFSEMLPMLKTLSSKGARKPKISYIDNKEGIWKIYQDMSGAKVGMFVSSYEKMESYFLKSTEKWTAYFKNRAKQNHRHLVPDTRIEKELAKKFIEVGQEVKFSKDITDSSMDFAIYDNKLAITSLENEPFMVVIESQELTNSMKPMFESMWEKGKEIK